MRSFEWAYSIKVIPTLLQGLKYTLLISICGILLGFILGLIAGLARIKKKGFCYRLASGYVGIIRGTPLMVQALYLYFAIPMIFNFNLNVILAGIITIALNSGAYMSEVVRGAIQAIDKGQNEAGYCLGLTKIQTMIHIIFPQAFKIMIPGLGNQFIISVKDTSLLTVIGVAEVTRQATQAVATSFRAVEIYTSLAIVYLVLVSILSYLLHLLERRLK